MGQNNGIKNKILEALAWPFKGFKGDPLPEAPTKVTPESELPLVVDLSPEATGKAPPKAELPSEAPNLHEFTPAESNLKGFEHRDRYMPIEIDANKIEDKDGFINNFLSKLRVESCKKQERNAEDVLGDLNYFDPNYAEFAKRTIEAIVYLEGDSKEHGKLKNVYDWRLSKDNIFKEFEQKPPEFSRYPNVSWDMLGQKEPKEYIGGTFGNQSLGQRTPSVVHA
jgi:hypothetical protein